MLNAPRSFYCKECDHPFYPEEYLASRGVARPSSTKPSQACSILPPPEDIARFLHPHGLISPSSDLIHPPVSLTINSVTREIAYLESISVDEDHVFFNCGPGPVTSVTFAGDDTVACLVSHCRIVIHQLDNTVSYKFPDFIHSIKFVRHLHNSTSGVLGIVFLDRIELWLVRSDGIGRCWSTEVTFPTCFDARLVASHIELLVGTENEGVVYFSINDSFVVEYTRRFPESSSVASVAFLRAPGVSNFFISGPLSGENISLWDLRDTRGPVNSFPNMSGNRRFLTGLSPSSIDPATVFAAFQSGTIVNLPNMTMMAIGGEVKSAQCFGVDSLGSRVFVAMSTGAVLTVDNTVRDKLKRAMTDYVVTWDGKKGGMMEKMDFPDMSELEKKIFSSISSSWRDVSVTIHPPKRRTTQLKKLRATDGACNERSGDGWVPIKCLAVGDERVGYGTDAGIVHIFRYDIN